MTGPVFYGVLFRINLLLRIATFGYNSRPRSGAHLEKITQSVSTPRHRDVIQSASQKTSVFLRYTSS